MGPLCMQMKQLGTNRYKADLEAENIKTAMIQDIISGQSSSLHSVQCHVHTSQNQDPHIF